MVNRGPSLLSKGLPTELKTKGVPEQSAACIIHFEMLKCSHVGSNFSVNLDLGTLKLSGTAFVYYESIALLEVNMLS